MLPSTTDPTTLFDLTWEAGSEIEPNDLTTEAQQSTLGVADGAVRAREIDGSLERAGWNKSQTPVVIDNPGCGTGTGTRSPMGQGEYAGDVDAFVLTIDEDGTLCARVVIDGISGVGWDLVLFPVDDCEIPDPPIMGSDGLPLGYDLGGAADGWGYDVRAGERYAVQLAAYHADDPLQTIPYSLGLSLIRKAADEEGPALCPRLPVEGP